MENDELEKIYSDYYALVYRYIFALCRNRATAQDLTQDTFMKSLIHLSECEYTTIKSWLFKVAYNLYISYLRKQNRFDFNVALDDLKDKSDFENEILSEIQYQQLLIHINSLPNNQKMAVLLCDVSGVKQTDAAEILGISHAALRNMLLRARCKLRTIIKGEL